MGDQSFLTMDDKSPPPFNFNGNKVDTQPQYPRGNLFGPHHPVFAQPRAASSIVDAARTHFFSSIEPVGTWPFNFQPPVSGLTGSGFGVGPIPPFARFDPVGPPATSIWKDEAAQARTDAGPIRTWEGDIGMYQDEIEVAAKITFPEDDDI